MNLPKYENKPFKPPRRIDSSRPSSEGSIRSSSSSAAAATHSIQSKGYSLKRPSTISPLSSLSQINKKSKVNNNDICTTHETKGLNIDTIVYMMMYRKPSSKKKKFRTGDGFAKYISMSKRLSFYSDAGKFLGSLPISLDMVNCDSIYKTGSWEYQLDYKIEDSSELQSTIDLINKKKITPSPSAKKSSFSNNRNLSSSPTPVSKSIALPTSTATATATATATMAELNKDNTLIPISNLFHSGNLSSKFVPVMKKADIYTDSKAITNSKPSKTSSSIGVAPKRTYLPLFDISKMKNPIIMNKLRTTPIDVIIDPLLGNLLRPHQVEAVKFMYDCIMGFERKIIKEHSSQISTNHHKPQILNKDSDISGGCLLADEMGLGKTLSTITLIWTLLKQTPFPWLSPCTQAGVPSQGLLKKVLIACPVTLIQNWKNEFKKWLSLNRIGILTLNANNTAAKDRTDVRNFLRVGRTYHVLIIGYEKLINVADELIDDSNNHPHKIDLLVCDEGHRLKNNNSKILNTLKNLNIEKKILLTGTPIQNDLVEFFTIIDFLNPSIFGSFQSFKKRFITPITRARDMSNSGNFAVIEKGEARSQELIEITQKFILRRTNDILTRYLPPRTDLILFCKPSQSQLGIFRSILTQSSCDFSSANFNSSLELITLLKKVCNSPSLLTSDSFYNSKIKSQQANVSLNSYENKTNESGKLRVLMELLKKIQSVTDGKEKVVIVSNYTQTLDIIQNLLSSASMSFVRLDGSTPSKQRDAIVKEFNKIPSIFAFLLSAKSGGVGLNLIGASRLVLFDNDWNPSIDLQAMSRIHRDGQKKPCYIYRLVTTGCIDEKILQRQLMKNNLSKKFLGDSSKENRDSVKDDLFLKSDLKNLFTVLTNTPSNTHDLICSCEGLGDEIQYSDEDDSDISRDISLEYQSSSPWITGLQAQKFIENKDYNSSRNTSTSIKKCLLGYRHINPHNTRDVFDEVLSQTLPNLKADLTFAFIKPGEDAEPIILSSK
ncbi:hypothetical protein TBLA_0G03190 [Henningerozyma blattae CBS 6284]|uniref:DNA repair and recombination protein RDH54 n=1 Tax=Henningerozyma blattae (strain ATCC 34711 / CBS 6284 / DSM 70876 / NBRC 10599 / NRRL Y-10934 / UCD 77-7) TaxID=1071380 RepID=I2H7A4_HENB6|nr:hypothetical protein TBLA_0G03190 [Tetrapisispora blattae CBS 6284]CCH62256.1 hypothetical protein TBLA_0G03190 [Tetrapisispora blattae CBS 6284]